MADDATRSAAARRPAEEARNAVMDEIAAHTLSPGARLSIMSRADAYGAAREALGRAEEREACAKIAESHDVSLGREAAYRIRDAIRVFGNRLPPGAPVGLHIADNHVTGVVALGAIGRADSCYRCGVKWPCPTREMARAALGADAETVREDMIRLRGTDTFHASGFARTEGEP